ncbi:hypothetical protein CFC21_075556 [Triticum aestivum]|uniref:KIB1-4 beta-propeller domain-containing protein n=2 Tax=Triticum aestivum TaxID=4565 RepID=A0A9R1HQ76_WHEAT|nr:hypothetical protein CFC21_075549 [Triticum aestivum]KAF7069993.1 hypothetical protein CFC21_075556 [Triticum aestivum]
MAAAAGLHQDVLARILLLLSCIVDRVRASAVNKHWRRVSLQNPPPLPRLLRPSTARTESYRIFGGFVDLHPSLSDEGRGPRFCGSAPGGWFVMSSQPWRGHALLNLRTGERVALPERVRIPLEFGLGVITCPMMIRAAVMSSAPPSGACLVAAVTSSQTNLAFWRPGMECWLSAPAVGRFVRNAEDITYHDGWFCAVESDDDLVCYKPEIAPAEDGAPSLTIRHHAYNLHVHGHRTAPGEIVSRYLLPSASGADLLMKSGQVLFVGRACSKAFYTGHTGGPGYIYFLDDVYTGGPHSVAQQNEYPCVDAGGWRYSVPDEIQRCLPWLPPSDTSPCIWYHH